MHRISRAGSRLLNSSFLQDCCFSCLNNFLGFLELIQNVEYHSFRYCYLLGMCCNLLLRRSISDYILICESGCLERINLYSNPVRVDLLLVPFLLQSIEKVATGTSKISGHRIGPSS
jgi:hypothetical protein